MSEALHRQLERAEQLLQQGKLTAALEEYRRIVQAVPGELSARQKLAEILVRQGQVPAAVNEYAEVVKRYAEQGDFFKATALCRVILSLEPKHQLAQQQLAALYASRSAPAANAAARPPPLPGARLQAAAFQPAPALIVSPAGDEPEEIAAEDLIAVPEPPLPPRDALPHIPLFSSLTTEAFLAVLNGALDARTVRAGETIVAEGAAGSSMYAVVQGAVSVWRKAQRVAQLAEGEFFGELALLTGAPRVATVKADTDVVVLEFPRESMTKVMAAHPVVRAGLEKFAQERQRSSGSNAV